MTAVAILLAAGSGERMAGDRPKAFLTIDGRSLLTIAAEAACACPRIGSLVVAAPFGWEQRASALLPARTPAEVVAGGGTRQESVRLALAAVPEDASVVVVHDAARALAPPSLFDAVVHALDDGTDLADRATGAIPTVVVPDTVKRVDGEWVAETVPREGLVLAQTPQAFLREPLVDAHRRAVEAELEFTDDAALIEWAGGLVRTVPGSADNFKVTTPEDLERAALVLRRGEPQ
jgi:2-C-methyl-D-erythritol 4-phosphate cytidylyltransferase/2-C-methyl-D-erythritol 2,4-cyclodiphosphate synthase